MDLQTVYSIVLLTITTEMMTIGAAIKLGKFSMPWKSAPRHQGRPQASAPLAHDPVNVAQHNAGQTSNFARPPAPGWVIPDQTGPHGSTKSNVMHSPPVQTNYETRPVGSNAVLGQSEPQGSVFSNTAQHHYNPSYQPSAPVDPSASQDRSQKWDTRTSFFPSVPVLVPIIMRQPVLGSSRRFHSPSNASVTPANPNTTTVASTALPNSLNATVISNSSEFYVRVKHDGNTTKPSYSVSFRIIRDGGQIKSSDLFQYPEFRMQTYPSSTRNATFVVYKSESMPNSTHKNEELIRELLLKHANECFAVTGDFKNATVINVQC